MTGADLVVDLQLLTSAATSLTKLHAEFGSAGRWCQDVEGRQESVGEPHLLSALGSFDSDWKAHREQLVTSIDTARKMVQTSHATYLSTDQQLAKVLIAPDVQPATFCTIGRVRR